MPDYPEHEKLTRQMQLNEVSQLIGQHLDYGWVDKHERKYVLCVAEPDIEVFTADEWGNAEDRLPYYSPVTDINAALADLLEIDLNKLEEEKRAMLEAQRALNEERHGTPAG